MLRRRCRANGVVSIPVSPDVGGRRDGALLRLSSRGLDSRIAPSVFRPLSRRPTNRSVPSSGPPGFESRRWTHQSTVTSRFGTSRLGVAPIVFRSPSVTHIVVVEPERSFALSGASGPGSNPGGERRRSVTVARCFSAPAVFRPFCVSVAQSGQSFGLRSRIAQVRILPETFAACIAHRRRSESPVAAPVIR